MDTQHLQIFGRKIIVPTPNLAPRGFALVTCLTVLPLLVGIFFSVGTLVYVLQRKSHAQSVCVQRTSLLTNELGQRLQALIRLNVHARRLRRARHHAERALRAAKLTLVEPLILAAEITLQTIKAAQVILDVRQRAILAEAEIIRLRHRRELWQDVRQLRASGVRLSSIERRALAVEARPSNQIAPEYLPVSDFARRQAQAVRFSVPLTPPFGRWKAIRQDTACVITLQRKDKSWKPRILAANAR